jgi:carbonic anhydrase
MTEARNDELRTEITAHTHVPTDDWDFQPIVDQHATLIADIRLLRDCPLVPASVAIAALIYDVDSGRLAVESTI